MYSSARITSTAILLFATGCAAPAASRSSTPAPTQSPAKAQTASPPPTPVVLSVVGTSDLHGRIDRLPPLAGYLANLRRVRALDGDVVLVDSGDMFQGTLESNLGEGAAVIDGMNAMGYEAAAIGNHEFDYGPVGPHSTPQGPGEDPRGALAARARQARFPLLSANLVQANGEGLFRLPGGGASAVVVAHGVRVGIIGAATMEELRTTAAPNVADLRLEPIAPAIAREAERLRNEQRVSVVVVAAHAGGACHKLDNPHDVSSCEERSELFELARALPSGLVDVIAGGHTHAAVAHEVNGIALIESWAQGRAFGRVDVTVDAAGHVIGREIRPPQELCTGPADRGGASCTPGSYEGAPVQPDAALAAALRPAMEAGEAARARELGVVVSAPIGRQHQSECALGNMLADLMRAARPGADVAIMNGGGIRADLPAGPLTYGAFYSVFPFDNRFARTRMKGSQLKAILAKNATDGGGFLSVSGVKATVRCVGGKVDVELKRDNGRLVRDDDTLVVLASDFLATGGDGSFASAGVGPEAFELESDPPIREALVQVLTARGGKVGPDDYFSATKPRVRLGGSRPLSCTPNAAKSGG